MKLDPHNTTLIKQKFSVLGNEIAETKTKLTTLNQALKKAKDSGVDTTSAEFRKLEREIELSKNKLKTLNTEFATFKAKASSVGIVAGKMKKLGTTMKTVGSRMAGVSAGIGIIGTMAVSVGTEFDQAMAKVQATSGATAKDFKALRREAIKMGEKTKFSATDSAEALNYMAMAGWSANEMLDGLSGVLDLASASGTDLATTSDIVTDGLTAMGLKAKDSGHFADVLATASANANTNVELMGETFKYSAPVAGALGYSIEDLAIATGLMANSGIKASQAGTSLRSIMTRMSAPTDAVAKAMDYLGVSMTDSEGNARPLRDVLKDLRTSMANLSETEKTQIANDIAGKNAMSGFLAVVNASDEDFNKLANAIDNADGSAEAMSDIMNDTFAGQITRIKSALGSMAITVSDSVAPALRGIADKVEKFASKINSANPKVKQMIVVFTALVGIVAPVLIGMGALAGAMGGALMNFVKIVPAVKKYATALKSVGVAQKLAFLSNPVVLAIAGMVAGFILLYKTSKTFRTAVKKAFTDIKTAFGELWEQVKPALSELGSTLLPVIKNVLGIVGKAVAKLVPVVASAVTTAIKRVTAIVKAIKTIITAIKNVAKKVKDTIVPPFTKAKEKIKAVIDKIKGFFSNLKPKINKPDFSKVSDVKDKIKEKIDKIKGFFTDLKPKFNKPDISNITAIYDTIKDKIDAIKKLFSNTKLKFNQKIKLPKFNMKGGFNAKDKSVPEVGVTWKASAMRYGEILKKPTIFGMQNGKLLGGGEVGSETVVGTSSLMSMISNSVQSAMASMGNNVASAVATGMQIGTSGASAGGDIALDVYLFKNGDHLGRTIVKTYDTYKGRLG